MRSPLLMLGLGALALVLAACDGELQGGARDLGRDAPVTPLVDAQAPADADASRPADQLAPLADRGGPGPDGSAPGPDQTIPSPDQAIPTPDQTVPTPDQAIPTPDQTIPTPDQTIPTPDQQVPAPDQQLPAPDQQVPAPDQQLPAPDQETTAWLAARYPGDDGIANDPAVVFAESFEQGSVAAVVARYNDYKNQAGMSLVADVPALSSGAASLRLTAGGSGPSATDLYKQLSNNYDELYLRYYVKYESGVTWHHSGVWIGGYNPPLAWPNPQAGIKPDGDDRFSVSIEPMGAGSSPGPRLDFYNYWMNMHASTAYWGNTLIHRTDFAADNDSWMCIEIQVKLNPNPASAAGAELAVWKDDVLVQRFTDSAPLGYWLHDKFCPENATSSECTNYPPSSGTTLIPLDLQFRNTTALGLNYFWPQNYITDGPAGSLYYDDMVLATTRIGCIR